MRGIFIDTSAFLAVVSPADHHHARAAAVYPTLPDGYPVAFTSNFVFGETVTLIARRLGFDAARSFGENLIASKWIRNVSADTAIEDRAWKRFVKHRDTEISYVDAVSFALMDLIGLDTAFTFDGDFAKAGFEVVP